MKKLLLGMVLSTLASAAFADDKMPSTTVALDSGWYLSVDGSWQNVSLPDYGLGLRKVTAPPFYPDAGPFQVFSPQLNGYSVQGTVGYALPAAASDTLFGANTRMEFGGLYTHASGTDTGTTLYTGGGVVGLFMDGTGANSGYLCSDFQRCTTDSSLSSAYSSWQLHGRVAGDYRWGAVLLTPSLAVFGGNTHVDQSMNQVLHISTSENTYEASTSLRWRDIGARAGLDLKVDVTPRLTLGLGGWGGFAGRHVSFEASDSDTSASLGSITGSGSASGNANAVPFVANAEANAAFKWLPTLTVRGFAGLNFDSKVPGVAAPTFGSAFSPPESRTPAEISFHSEVSYYAGGGITWKF